MATSGTIRVLIVDDHDLARAGIKGIVEDQGDMQVVAQAAGGVEALAAFEEHAPDVVLMDVRMPDFDGIQATAALRRDHPGARVLIISSYDTEEDVFRAHEAGARGYLLKESRGDEIVSAIRTVAAGGRHTPPLIAKRLAERNATPALTSREKQILALLHEGLSNPQIAKRLGLSAGTIRMYVSQVLEKLGAANRTEAVTIGLEKGLIRKTDTTDG